jgi:putative membrane protein
VIRLLVRVAVAVAANAVGLIVAAALLDGVHLNGGAFVLAVVIFTVVVALLQPFLVVQMRRRLLVALVVAPLLATLVSLIVTDLLSDGLTINGAGTWIAATVIVWLAALLAGLILPFLGLRKFMEERRD